MADSSFSVGAGVPTTPEAMMAMIPEHVTEEINSITDETAAPAEDLPIDEPEPEPVVEETAAEPDAEVTQEPVAPTADDLPDGIKLGKGRDGKPLYFVDPDRWKNSIYPNHQLVQQASTVIGEPLTMQALQSRQQAFMEHQAMFVDLNSGDPSAQGNALNFILEDMKRAHQSGEVGSDPTESFVKTFYDTIRESAPQAYESFAKTFYDTIRESAPQAYAGVRFSAAKDLMSEMYELAAQKNSSSLFGSAQQMALTLAGIDPAMLRQPNGLETARSTMERMGIPFYLLEEMPALARGPDPVAQLRQELAQAKSQLKGRQTNTQAEQHRNWQNATNQAIASSIDTGAIQPAIASVAEAWKAFPDHYQREVITPLNKAVNDTLASDGEFQNRISLLKVQAQRATSQQVRDRIAGEIKEAFTNRAKQAVEAHKRPILESAAKWLKGWSASNNDRRAAGQSRTAPKGATSPVPHSLIPGNIDKSNFTSNGVFDPAKAARVVNQYIPR